MIASDTCFFDAQKPEKLGGEGLANALSKENINMRLWLHV